MRLVAIIAFHLVPLIIASCGHWQVALIITFLLHLSILASTLLPGFSIMGKLVKHTRDLPPNIADDGTVLLTFDDGPHPEFTPRILDLLDEHETKAIFFVIGEKAIEHPDIIRDIVARGHLIGNHTQTHPERKFWRLLPRSTASEIDQCQNAIEIITGERPVLFRPPVGMHNPFLFDALQQRSLPCVIWTHRGFDTKTKNTDVVVNRLTRNLAPGSILMIHDHLPGSVEITRQTLNTIHNRRLTLAGKN